MQSRWRDLTRSSLPFFMKGRQMFEAQYLMTKNNTTGIVVFSPWFPRKGDNIQYAIDLIEAVGAKISVTLFTKNTEDPGDGTTTGSAISLTNTVGVTSEVLKQGVVELVRYQFNVVADASNTLGWVLFRMLSPVWFDSVKA